MIPTLMGHSPAMQRLRAQITRVAALPIPVLIEGPTGSGKELVATALHTESGRRGPFVAFNVCAIPEAMFEATLFGHVRGAFTGATADADGLLTHAHQGTVFFDEIGGLIPSLQVKLLRAVETQEFWPVGARAARQSEFRVVAATNEPLARLMADGHFRPDLFYRLSGAVLTIPPLSAHRDDVPALARHFVATCAREFGWPPVVLTDDAIRALSRQEWPGNVRELRRTIERAVMLADGARIDVAVIECAVHGAMQGATASDQPPHQAEEDEPFNRLRLLQVLERCDWNASRAADALGVHRATVYRRLHRLGLTRPEAAVAPAIDPAVSEPESPR